MGFIDIGTEYNVQIRSVNDEHRLIAQTVSTIHDSILEADKTAIIEEMKKLMEILKSHFENEERLMKENQFTGYIFHKLEHDRFYKQILTTIDSYGKGEIQLGLEQLKGIRRWFFNHIDLNDRKCCKFLSDKGIL